MTITTSDIGEHRLDWHGLVLTLKKNGLNSIMVEGGGRVINSLLEPQYLPEIDCHRHHSSDLARRRWCRRLSC